MAPSKLQQVVGAVKDQTSIGLAKVGSGGSAASELDVAIVKATRHSESFPAEERHIREILALARCSSSGNGVYVSACVSSLSHRLGRTRSWAVALKTLVIVHRLLADGDPALERELFYATRRGTRMLNMSDFCDRSAWDFSAFVRTYAAYLDDRLEYRMQGRKGGARGARQLREEMYMSSPGNRSPYDGDDVAAVDANNSNKAALVTRDTPTSEMTVDQLLTKGNQLQHLLDRFIACRPVGAAKANRVVAVSLYPLVKESVQLYCELTEVMAALIDRFAEMETADCERVHGLFTGLAKDMEELEAFYAWCKDACVCRQSDVPEVEAVTQKKLELMDEFIHDRRAAESHPQQRLLPLEPATSPEPPLLFEMNAAIKALPAPEEPPAAAAQEDDDHAGETATGAEPEPLLLIAAEPADGEADFLNLKADAVSSEAHGQQMALALFNGALSAPTGNTAFDPSSADWETALVQSASTLANQRAELGGGFNMMVLDGMYGHTTDNATVATFSGSASSVAMRPAGAPMLALPAPPGDSGTAIGADPFAASALVPPPSYVQMSDLQTKQQLLTQEQMLWQRYGKNGMQGPGAMAVLEQRPHHQQLLPHTSHNYYAVNHRSS